MSLLCDARRIKSTSNMRVPLTLTLAIFLVSCQAPSRDTEAGRGPATAPAVARLPVPPPMPRRAIAPPATAPAGEQVQLADGDVKFTLFIPIGWRPGESGETSITAHFHGAVWFAIDEHLRRGLDEPLVCFALGEGSSVYARPFKDRQRFGRIIKLIEADLSQRGPWPAARVVRIDVSSFSAGYGAVREIVQVPEYVKLLRRVVLADSLYAGWDPSTTRPGATSRPAAENIEPWRAFVEAAASGKDGKTFILTHSQVPTSYANTEACARALIEMVGARIEPVERGALPATLDPDFPLLYRADKGNFHVWGYGGVDGPAHMTHPRHIAEVWRALDEADVAGPSELRRGMSMRDPPQVRQRKYFETLGRQIEPRLQGDSSKLDVYLRFFERAVVRERRLFAFHVTVGPRDGNVLLSGQAEYTQQVRSLVMLLQTLGFEVEDQIELTPTKPLGDTPYGIVRAPRSFIYASPEPRAEVVNEVLRGETLFLLHAVDAERRMYWCHAPDGYVGWIRAEDVERVNGKRLAQALSPNASSPDPRIEAIIASAQSKVGLPYIWGGRSDEGVDCSGLVQTAFASQGIYLPRDAEQQAIVGKLVATRWHRDALRRGDVLFFMGRRGTVSHTAIYLGDDQYIESSGRVKISSFRADDDGYSRSRDDSFCFAKRMVE